MSSYTILITKRFEKDLEICKKRGLKLSLLYTVIEQLILILTSTGTHSDLF